MVHARARFLPAIVTLALLAGCGLPGVTVVPPGATEEPAQIGDAGIVATIEARQTATAQARQQPSAAPSATRSTTTPRPQPTRTPAPSASASASVPPTPQLSQPPAVAPGTSAAPIGDSALVAIGRDGSVSVLRDGQWNAPIGALGRCFPPSIEFDASGVLWLSCNEALTSADGAIWAPAGVDRYARFFAGPDGAIWALSSDRAQLRSDDEWTTFNTQQIGSSNVPRQAAAFMPDGTVYFGGPSVDRTLISFNGQTWAAFGDQARLRGTGATALLASAGGDLLAGSLFGSVSRWDGDSFRELISDSKFERAIGSYSFNTEIRDLAETPDGMLWIATAEGLFRWDGTTLKVFDPNEGLPARDVYDLEIDAAGRLWLATGNGIAVRDGDTWQIAQPGTSALPESFVVALAVRGAPSLPPPDAQPRTTTIRGRLTDAGAPLSDTDVRLCSEAPSVLNKRNERAGPCSNMAFYQTVQTDDNGDFRFENVPIGTYAMVARDRSNRWATFVGVDVRALEPGVEVVQDLQIR